MERKESNQTKKKLPSVKFRENKIFKNLLYVYITHHLLDSVLIVCGPGLVGQYKPVGHLHETKVRNCDDSPGRPYR